MTDSTRGRSVVWLGGVLAVALHACTGPGSDPGPAPDPGAAFLSLESDLMERGATLIGFEVTAEGAFTAALEGDLTLLVGNELELTAEGVFGGEPVRLELVGRDRVMAWGNQDGRAQEPTPEALREAVVIGLTRMGVLHNLARLVAGAPPDRVDGTVRSWVEAEGFRWEAGGPDPDDRGIAFTIRVAGQEAGDATVWLDPDGGLVGRDQVVRFPGGEMRVRERYRIR